MSLGSKRLFGASQSGHHCLAKPFLAHPHIFFLGRANNGEGNYLGMLLIDPIGRQNSVRMYLKCRKVMPFYNKFVRWIWIQPSIGKVGATGMNPESQVGLSPNQRYFRYFKRYITEPNIVFGPPCNALILSLCTALIPHVHIPLLLLLLNLTASESCLFNRRFAYPSREEHEVAKYESAVVISFRYALNFGGWKWTGFGLELHKRSK